MQWLKMARRFAARLAERLRPVRPGRLPRLPADAQAAARFLGLESVALTFLLEEDEVAFLTRYAALAARPGFSPARFPWEYAQFVLLEAKAKGHHGDFRLVAERLAQGMGVRLSAAEVRDVVGGSLTHLMFRLGYRDVTRDGARHRVFAELDESGRALHVLVLEDLLQGEGRCRLNR